ncbi:glycosyltransferase [Streptomyces sp. NPDC091268]|uniref:glycosyltransferase n=1 Tax=Streptomyces sp. NPDC091268 TaxID=3365979 RepID=UPI00381F8526
MDTSVAITLVTAALLIPFLMPHPRTVRARRQYDLPEPEPEPTPPSAGAVTYSLLVPLRHEADAGVMLAELLRSPRRDFEVLLLLGDDDSVSEPPCLELAARHPDRVRVVRSPAAAVRTLAGSLNTALPHCNGSVIGVIQGGDPVRGSLLDRVDGAYRASGAAIVRLGVTVPDDAPSAEAHWLLHGLVYVRGRRPVRVARRVHLTPSGVYFVRADLLRMLGGWDEDCLDAELELMLRLFSFGAVDAMLYGEPARDHASHRSGRPAAQWGRLQRRRVRWYTSLIQVYRTREWRRFASFRDRMAARRALLGPVLQGLLGLPALLGALLLALAWPDQPVYRFALPVWVAYASAVMTAWGAAWLRMAGRGRPRTLLADRLSMATLRLEFLLIGGWGMDLLVRFLAAGEAVWGYLRGDAEVLSDHFERSRRPPSRPPRPSAGGARDGAADDAGAPDPSVPPDLLDVAGSPDTPAAVHAMATGLDALFRALGPPPASLRLAEAGPTPQGDGGTSDG